MDAQVGPGGPDASPALDAYGPGEVSIRERVVRAVPRWGQKALERSLSGLAKELRTAEPNPTRVQARIRQVVGAYEFWREQTGEDNSSANQPDIFPVLRNVVGVRDLELRAEVLSFLDALVPAKEPAPFFNDWPTDTEIQEWTQPQEEREERLRLRELTWREERRGGDARRGALFLVASKAQNLSTPERALESPAGRVAAIDEAIRHEIQGVAVSNLLASANPTEELLDIKATLEDRELPKAFFPIFDEALLGQVSREAREAWAVASRPDENKDTLLRLLGESADPVHLPAIWDEFSGDPRRRDELIAYLKRIPPDALASEASLVIRKASGLDKADLEKCAQVLDLLCTLYIDSDSFENSSEVRARDLLKIRLGFWNRELPLPYLPATAQRLKDMFSRSFSPPVSYRDHALIEHVFDALAESFSGTEIGTCLEASRESYWAAYEETDPDGLMAFLVQRLENRVPLFDGIVGLRARDEISEASPGAFNQVLRAWLLAELNEGVMGEYQSDRLITRVEELLAPDSSDPDVLLMLFGTFCEIEQASHDYGRRLSRYNRSRMEGTWLMDWLPTLFEGFWDDQTQASAMAEALVGRVFARLEQGAVEDCVSGLSILTKVLTSEDYWPITLREEISSRVGESLELGRSGLFDAISSLCSSRDASDLEGRILLRERLAELARLPHFGTDDRARLLEIAAPLLDDLQSDMMEVFLHSRIFAAVTEARSSGAVPVLEERRLQSFDADFPEQAVQIHMMHAAFGALANIEVWLSDVLVVEKGLWEDLIREGQAYDETYDRMIAGWAQRCGVAEHVEPMDAELSGQAFREKCKFFFREHNARLRSASYHDPTLHNAQRLGVVLAAFREPEAFWPETMSALATHIEDGCDMRPFFDALAEPDAWFLDDVCRDSYGGYPFQFNCASSLLGNYARGLVVPALRRPFERDPEIFIPARDGD